MNPTRQPTFCLGMLALCACSSSEQSERARSARSVDQAPPGSIVVLEANKVIKAGAIGVNVRQDATYVLVDVENRSNRERRVALDGMLRDHAGGEVGALSVDELSIPAGETRTFALVYNQVAPGAVDATFRVRGSAAIDYAAPVVITSLEVEPLPNTVAAWVRMENKEGRPVVATLLATFYGADGKILGRPFTILELHANASRPFRFVGPPGATRAVAFVGDVLQ